MTRAIFAASILLAAGACSGEPSWEALPLGTKADFRNIFFTDTMHGWIAGGSYEITGGLIGRTSDGGRTWRFVSNLTERERMSVGGLHFFDTSRGIAVTGAANVLATNDGGETWTPVETQGRATGLSSLFFLDERRGWAAGTGDVIRTGDGGDHWTRAAGEFNGDINYRSPIRAMQFFDENTGWVAGMQAYLARTFDGGNSWESVTPIVKPEHPNFWGVSFVDRQYGWVVGEEGAMVSTTDGGLTWTRRMTGLKDAHSATKLEQVPTARGPVTIDAGDRTPGFTISAVHFIDRNHGWITGFYAGLGRSLILRTEDAGTTWIVDADIAGEELYTLFFEGNTTAWAIGSRVREGSQAIYRRTLGAK